MHEHIQTLEYYVPEDLCRRIVAIGTTRPLLPGLCNNKKLDPEQRSSMITFFTEGDSETKWIFDLVWKAIENHPLRAEVKKLKFIQFAEYGSEYGGFFKKHRDTEIFYHASSVSKDIRILTCVVSLADPLLYDGGELALYDEDGEEIKFRCGRGCALLFPSDMPHEVKKVTRGTRYSISCWFEGPR